MRWYIEVLKKYVVFTGRAGRKEFWYFTLVSFIVNICLSLLDRFLGMGGEGLLGLIYMVATLLPSLGVSFRRLHDTGRSAWWMLTVFIPILGVFVYLGLMAMKGQEGDNQYGQNPQNQTA